MLIKHFHQSWGPLSLTMVPLPHLHTPAIELRFGSACHAPGPTIAVCCPLIPGAWELQAALWAAEGGPAPSAQGANTKETDSQGPARQEPLEAAASLAVLPRSPPPALLGLTRPAALRTGLSLRWPHRTPCQAVVTLPNSAASAPGPCSRRLPGEPSQAAHAVAETGPARTPRLRAMREMDLTARHHWQSGTSAKAKPTARDQASRDGPRGPSGCRGLAKVNQGP